MIDTNAIFLADTYKMTHNRMYSKNLTKLVSYWVPRKSMFKSIDKMVFFGLQAFLQEYLVDYFNKNFFDREINDVITEFNSYMGVHLGLENFDTEPIVDLHMLGYLPLMIRAIPEGTVVNMGIPCIEITNTNPHFAWVVQWIECILQSELWKMCNHATISKMYLDLAKKYYSETCDDSCDPRMAAADFGMRGMSCMNEAIRCSSAWLLCFNKTSTIPALPYIDKYYNADVRHTKIGLGAVSTEHSVISSHFAEDGSEVPFLKKMLTEIYPNSSFSFLGDTYDYWNFVKNIIPECKEEILKHKGKLLIRPDSGDQIECVTKTLDIFWDEFGGTVNSKGYKVLDSHIGIILGDGCTHRVVDQIWTWMKEHKYAANNVVFGVGAFCFSALWDNEKLKVNTRDCFGIAAKASFAIIDNKPMMLYKDPKTDTSHLKKSHKGIVHVFYDSEGNLVCTDKHEQLLDEHNSALKCVFNDGILMNKTTFAEIRERINK